MQKPIQLAFFNHKGGVSKTTSTFHIGWKLAEYGKRVVLVDCDPQCNLTGLVLTYSSEEQYPYATTDENSPLNIRDGLLPVFDGRPVALRPVELQKVPHRDGLFVLPGHVGFAEFESQLAISHELSGSLSVMRNMPGSLRWLLNLTAQSVDADYVLIDMSPSLGALNQNLLATSDAFIVPVAPDFFSAMALRSLSRVLPKWAQWSRKAAEQPILAEATYPWPNRVPKYLGAIIQNYRVRARDGKAAEPTKAYRTWFDELKQAKQDALVPALRESDLLLAEKAYNEAKSPLDEFMLQIPDFNGLIASSQVHSKPVFTLTKAELESSGYVLDTQLDNIDHFNKVYTEGVKKILSLTE